MFSAFKNPEQDRQIGDRRRVNMAEISFDGPSKFLLPGQLLTQIGLARFSQKLVASITDRRDFYHQATVTDARAQTNFLPFCYPLSELSGLSATLDFLAKLDEKSSKPREAVGDRLGLPSQRKGRREAHAPKTLLFGGFASLFQGDHLGVEVALCSHQSLLEDEGLLDGSHQVQGFHCFPKGPKYSGLVIDDYFMIGREPANAPSHMRAAFAALETARGEKLWPLSASTLRKRFGDLMKASKLPQGASSREKLFDLSSLRPGGASWLLNTSEDSDLVRRRGRWAATRTMEIYLQEVLYATYVQKLPQEATDMIEVCAAGFPELLKHAQYFVSTAVPCGTWYPLLRNRLGAGQSGDYGVNTAVFARKNRAAD